MVPEDLERVKDAGSIRAVIKVIEKDDVAHEEGLVERKEQQFLLHFSEVSRTRKHKQLYSVEILDNNVAETVDTTVLSLDLNRQITRLHHRRVVVRVANSQSAQIARKLRLHDHHQLCFLLRFQGVPHQSGAEKRQELKVRAQVLVRQDQRQRLPRDNDRE